ncbi:MAG TPA: hypothetical protein VGO62_17865, partial [Myxococcota bacterium]
DKKMVGTVWVSGGCASWYLDDTGRNSTLWPSSTPAFRRAVHAFHPAAYDLVDVAGVAEPAGAPP